MKRGEVWTIAGGPDYAGKPRSAVAVHDDSFDATASVTVCASTTDPPEADLFRIPVEPSEHNGLRTAAGLTADKLTTVPRGKLGSRVGKHDDEDILGLNRAMLVFLGLAGSTRS